MKTHNFAVDIDDYYEYQNIMTSNEGNILRKIVTFKKIEETPEQKANKLGFKIGDYCWYIFLMKFPHSMQPSKKYEGRIKSFCYGIDKNVLMAEFDGVRCPLEYLTNKIYVETPTQEIYDLVCSITGQQLPYSSKCKGVTINENANQWISSEGYKGISLDFFMNEILNEKPLFESIGKKYIYDNQKYWYINENNEVCACFATKANKYNDNILRFPTEQALKDYLSSLKQGKLTDKEIIDLLINFNILYQRYAMCNKLGFGKTLFNELNKIQSILSENNIEI